MEKVVDFEFSNKDIEVDEPCELEIEVGVEENCNKYDYSFTPALGTEFIDKQLNELDQKIDFLTNNADWLDYMIAISSGILTAALDAILKEKRIKQVFGNNANDKDLLDFFNESGSQTINEKINKISKKEGTKKNAERSINKDNAMANTSEVNSDKLSGIVSYFEKRFNIPSDSLENEFGGSRKHHLNDFAHHPSILGLIFSLMTQFTKKCYGTDKDGNWKVVELKFSDDKDGRIAKVDGNGNVKYIKVIGKDFKEKLFFGIIIWYYHLISDLAGSSSTIRSVEKHDVSTIGIGAGVPGPLLSLAKELSVLPIFKRINKNGEEENLLAKKISELYDGTAFSKKDEFGNEIKRKIDFRTEVGVGKELKQQAIPVLLNEVIVRGFYFIRRLVMEIKENQIKSVRELNKINISNVLPVKNRTIVRMLTISTGTFVATNVAISAVIGAAKSGGNIGVFAKEMVLRINFVGVGRFVVAIGADITDGIKKSRLERSYFELLKLKNEKISDETKVQQINVLSDLSDVIDGNSSERINKTIKYLGED